MATLNSLSPWAERRREEAKRGHDLFSKALFRSPEDLVALGHGQGVFRTAVHFSKEEDPERGARTEEESQRKGLNTGAFLAARWLKP